jgi:hypothetical protein
VEGIFMLPNFWPPIPRLTLVIEALERFQDFETKNRAAAITFYSSQLAAQHGWSQEAAEIHLYRIASYAGLLGGEN